VSQIPNESCIYETYKHFNESKWWKIPGELEISKCSTSSIHWAWDGEISLHKAIQHRIRDGHANFALNCTNFTWNDPTEIKLALLGLTYHCLYQFIQLLTLFLKPFWINLRIVFSSTFDPEYKNSIRLWSLIPNSDYTLFTPLPDFTLKL
jgi:hypothetical protein